MSSIAVDDFPIGFLPSITPCVTNSMYTSRIVAISPYFQKEGSLIEACPQHQMDLLEQHEPTDRVPTVNHSPTVSLTLKKCQLILLCCLNGRP